MNSNTEMQATNVESAETTTSEVKTV